MFSSSPWGQAVRVPLGVTFYLVRSSPQASLALALPIILSGFVPPQGYVEPSKDSRILAKTVCFSCLTFLVCKMEAGLCPRPRYTLGFCDII